MENSLKKESFVTRMISGARYMITGVRPTDWMNPNQPIAPIAQESIGRQFDYQPSINIVYTPKTNEGITYAELRSFAENLPILRTVIETKKDLLCTLPFNIVPVDKSKKTNRNCKVVYDFLRNPDRENSWERWLRAILEDLLVVDAPTVWLQRTNNNALYAARLIDGTTIKRLITSSARTPEAPSPAYQQVLKGMPVVDYTADELIYLPRNLRTHKLYGYSPVEQIITIVDMGLRRQLSQVARFTHGTIPDALIKCPVDWNPDQIKQMQDLFDAMLSGNLQQQRKATFIPGGTDIIDTKDILLKDEFDEWLAKIICFAFSISPHAFIKMMNRASAEDLSSSSWESGILPTMQWVKSFIDKIINVGFGLTDVEFQWEQTQEIDLLKQAQVDEIYLRSGVFTPNEVRIKNGLEPLTEESANLTIREQNYAMLNQSNESSVNNNVDAAKIEAINLIKKKS